MSERVFNHLVRRVYDLAAGLPDPRTGDNTRYSMADVAMLPFAVFFTQCPSFLSFQQNPQKNAGRNNAHALFQIVHIPSDNHTRQTLDTVEPTPLFCLFGDQLDAFAKTGVLEAMHAVNHTRFIALYATWYYSSQAEHIHCPGCSCLQHADGTTTHFHSAIMPVIVCPGHDKVVPLRPEFITPHYDYGVGSYCRL